MSRRSEFGVKRRRFLEHFTRAAASASVLPAALSAPEARREPAATGKKIIIVGAGLAGLSAGYELTQSGHDVTILEAQTRPGGRVHTLRDPFAEGLHAEAGATRIPDHHQFTLKYAELFGLALEPFEPDDAVSVYYLRGRRLRVAPGQSVAWPYELTPEERTLGVSGMRRKYIWSVFAELGDVTDPNWPSPDLLQKYDAMDRSELWRSKGASPEAVALLSALSGIDDRAEARSALFMLRTQAQNHAVRRYYRIRGGNDLIAKGFARRLADKIRYAAPVVRIEQDSRGVKAVFESAGSYHAATGDYLVCAVPLPVQRNIEVAPAFSPGKQRAIERLPYLSDSKVFLQSRRRFWADDGESGFAMADLPIGQVWDLTYGHTGTRGILMARALSLHSRRITGMPEDERVAFALDQMEKIYPGTRDNFEGGMTKCWDEDKWARGASAYYAPGQLSSLLPHVARPEGRIHFAGEHTSVWVDGWMQGALESGNRVTVEIEAASRAAGANFPAG
jgi:monoamine oxidase